MRKAVRRTTRRKRSVDVAQGATVGSPVWMSRIEVYCVHGRSEMPQSDTRNTNNTATPNLFGGDLMGFGNKPIEALMGMQKQMLETFEQINKDRAARVQQETELASTFAGKLTSARSI